MLLRFLQLVWKSQTLDLRLKATPKTCTRSLHFLKKKKKNIYISVEKTNFSVITQSYKISFIHSVEKTSFDKGIFVNINFMAENFAIFFKRKRNEERFLPFYFKEKSDDQNKKNIENAYKYIIFNTFRIPLKITF